MKLIPELPYDEEKGHLIFLCFVMVIVLLCGFSLLYENIKEPTKENMYTLDNKTSSQFAIGSEIVEGNKVYIVYVGEDKKELKTLQFTAKDTVLKFDDKYKEAPYVIYRYNSLKEEYNEVTMYIPEDTKIVSSKQTDE